MPVGSGLISRGSANPPAAEGRTTMTLQVVAYLLIVAGYIIKLAIALLG